uniref:Uncharacterized protein n=1 Tax=Arundo donax TaxID=35708 RepID=A0A0A8YNU3_ARUDO
MAKVAWRIREYLKNLIYVKWQNPSSWSPTTGYSPGKEKGRVGLSFFFIRILV